MHFISRSILDQLFSAHEHRAHTPACLVHRNVISAFARALRRTHGATLQHRRVLVHNARAHSSICVMCVGVCVLECLMCDADFIVREIARLPGIILYKEKSALPWISGQGSAAIFRHYSLSTWMHTHTSESVEEVACILYSLYVSAHSHMNAQFTCIARLHHDQTSLQ